jgi:hypothetical protein
VLQPRIGGSHDDVQRTCSDADLNPMHGTEIELTTTIPQHCVAW